MTLFPKYITLNGRHTPIEEFINGKYEEVFIDKAAQFLGEWYSRSQYIKVHTSGSTGSPKMIKLKKSFVAESAYRTIKFFKLQPGDRVLHCLPTDYIAGKLMIIRALLGALNIDIVASSSNFNFLRRERYKFAAMVPHQVSKIIDRAEGNQLPLINSIEQLLIGGSALPPKLEQELQSVSTSCHMSYALTETASHIALRKINGDEKSSFYSCLPPIYVELSDQGSLRIFMSGQESSPIETTDLAQVIDKHRFRIIGRADNVIISGGKKFSPEVLEDKLGHYLTLPIAFAGHPHDTLGQQLTLFIEGDETPELKEEIKRVCHEKLTHFEQPRQIFFLKSLPKTKYGKIDRKKL